MISIIIPTLNEEVALPATITNIFNQAGDYEVIIVDGGSDDDTVVIASKNASIKLITAPKGRASQMNAGAAISNGEWLLFLHADTLLPDNALLTISSLESEHAIQAGGFHHQFSGKTLGLRFISWLHNLRCKRTKVFYGDQAMFVRKDMFKKLGGFPNKSMLEDLLFGEQLLKATKPLLLNDYVVTDSRKFEKNGTLKGLWQITLILTFHELGLGIPAQRFFTAVR